MSHTPEPWTEHTIVRFEDMSRVRACVNGCAGLNPAAYQHCVNVLKAVLASIQGADDQLERQVKEALHAVQATISNL